MSTNPEQGWGTWRDAERWRQDAFKNRSPAARLSWLEDIWRLRVATDAALAVKSESSESENDPAVRDMTNQSISRSRRLSGQEGS